MKEKYYMYFRKSVLLFLCMIGCFLSFGTVHASNKSSLLSKVTSRDSGNVVKKYYDDFDSDGKMELFAIVGSEYNYRLWYASAKEVEQLSVEGSLYYSNSMKPVAKVNKKQKLFLVESGYYGSDSFSQCYYVKKGIVYKAAKAGSGLKHIKGKLFAVHPGAFDHYTSEGYFSGHTYKRYYLKWTGSKFKEYTGKKISKSILKKYSGASSILKKAASNGFKIGTIYKRGNGIINVNLYKKNRYDTNYENLTLRIKGKKVQLVKLYGVSGSESWIDQYSYGGNYMASGF